MTVELTVVNQVEDVVVFPFDENLGCDADSFEILSKEMLERGVRMFVVDLRFTNHLGDGVMTRMLELQREARALGGDVKICDPSSSARFWLEIKGLGNSFEIHEDPLSAEESF